MTLAHTQQTGGAVDHHRPDQAPVAHHAQVSDLQQWAREAQASFQIAEMISGTEFCPQQFRGSPHKAAAAILAGSELGFSPMTSLNAFDVIQGATSLKAKTMLAIVQSKGHFTRFVEKSPTRVVMEGHRKGQPEGMQTVEWTIERADKAGYIKKNPNYGSKPQEMLTARATSELCRAIASDALLGIAYSSEELQDDPSLRETHPDERAGVAQLPRAAARGGTSMSAADLTGDAPIEQAPQPGPTDVSGAVEMIDRSQSTRIGKAFKDADVAQGDRLAIVNQLVDRQVAAPTELTKAEADGLLEALADLGADGIAALAGGGQADDTPSEGDDQDRSDEHAGLFEGDES